MGSPACGSYAHLPFNPQASPVPKKVQGYQDRLEFRAAGLRYPETRTSFNESISQSWDIL